MAPKASIVNTKIISGPKAEKGVQRNAPYAPSWPKGRRPPEVQPRHNHNYDTSPAGYKKG